MQVTERGCRTGTLTQSWHRAAGFAPCYHWVDVIADLDRVEAVGSALDGKADWQESSATCVATVDGRRLLYAELAQPTRRRRCCSAVATAALGAELRRDDLDMCFGDTLIHNLSAGPPRSTPAGSAKTWAIDRMFWIESGTSRGRARRRRR